MLSFLVFIAVTGLVLVVGVLFTRHSTSTAEPNEKSPPFEKERTHRRRWIAAAVAGSVILIAALFPLMKGGKPSVNPLQSVANSELQSALNRAIER